MTAIRNITEEQLARWFDLNARRATLEKEARTLKSEMDKISAEVMAALEAAGRTEMSRGNYAAEVRPGPAFVAWKEEFLKVAGAEAAAQVQKKAEPSQRFSVRKLDGV